MIVSLYINVNEQYDPSLELVVDRFKKRVEDDGGVFEAGTCLQNTIESLGGVYGIGLNTITDFQQRVLADGGVFESQNCLLQTINSLGGVAPAPAFRDVAKRIELFDDEKISLTSSIQNISDISKVFTDYTQSFTIPASDNNNEIFKHWYENSLDNGFDQRITYGGFIEIDTKTFRKGRWQLEGATIKNNRVEDYKITFYGELKSLNDKFKEDKLKDLNTLNDYSISYSGAGVLSNIKSATAQNVMFPFISSNRLWNIDNSIPTNNINNSSHRLSFKELFPAVKVKRIFNAIEDKYNINFSGTFLNDNRFEQAYLWLKNNEQPELNPLGQPGVLNLTGSNATDGTFQTNVTNETITLIEEAFDAFIRLDIALSASVNSQVSVYRDNVLFYNFSNVGIGIFQDIFIPNEDVGVEYRFEIATSQPTTFSGTISSGWINPNTGDTTINFLNNVSGSSANILNLTALAPDIKISDLFSGILKMFNLTAFSEDGINFTLEQLENWYYLGGIKDFSQYCTTDLSFERIKPYKKIDFKYQKSENLISRAFAENAQREYGDLTYTFNNDGSDYTIQLPFENLAFSPLDDFFQVGYAIKQDLAKYVPKPIILYRYGLQPATYHFNNGVSTTTETQYNAFGQETLYNGFKHSINWGVEISSLDLQLVNNTLFSNYYLAYLSNLYSLKSRMVKVKMRLPYTELLNLKLNDRIIIRDKRYIINQYTTDLTTFESDFELIQDFRSVTFNNSAILQTDNTAKTLRIDTTSTTALTWSEETSSGFIQSITNGDTYVDVEVKQNVSGLERNAVLVSNLNDKIIIRQNA